MARGWVIRAKQIEVEINTAEDRRSVLMQKVVYIKILVLGTKDGSGFFFLSLKNDNSSTVYKTIVLFKLLKLMAVFSF